MNSAYRIRKGNSGMALLTALMFISVTIIVLTSMTARYIQQRLQVDRFEDYYNCFEVAEAAVSVGKSALDRSEFVFRVGIPDEWEPQFDEETNMLILPEFDDDGIVPATFETVPGAEYIVYIHDWENDGRDTNGDGEIDSDAEIGMYSVHAAARLNGVVRRIEAIFSTHDIGVWRNAIFAGSGQAGGVINGNVSVAGSVHILGENIPDGGTAVTALDMIGASLIHNHYDGMPAYLRQRIPDIPIKTHYGEEVETLDAMLRVRRGRVALSGDAHIGQEFVSGSGLKGPMDGVYVTDGWTGNSVNPTPDGRGEPWKGFYADNGSQETYDLGNRVSFPLLTDDWRNPDGSRVHNPSTGTWYTHEEYFTEVLVADPDIPDDGIFNGDITLSARNEQGFYYNANTGEHITGAAVAALNPAALDPSHDYILMKPGTNSVLYINGNLRINGTLKFKSQGNGTTIHYSGRAAFLVNDLVIESNLITVNNGNPDDFVGTYPQDNCLGIMAYNSMEIGGSAAQLDIMGAFYAQDQIRSAKQTNVLGTFVSSYFNISNQVPSIWQVPVLASSLPLGMIGNYPILNVRSISWREIGV